MVVPSEIARLLHTQDGVIARRQALDAGMTATRIARLLRRRDWVAVHPGVYVAHTGPLGWRQRAWAAVLSCWPAALDATSALRAHDGPGLGFGGHRDADPITVVVAHQRRLQPPPGVLVRRMRALDDAVLWNLGPPRLRYEDAVLTLADAVTDDIRAIAVLAGACGGRRTTAERLLGRMRELTRMHRRAWLVDVLTDVATGTCSVLEHGYLTRVERPHGLPLGLRQVEETAPDGRRVFRDLCYGGKRPQWRQVVELDGRAFHSSSPDRDRDLERDLDTALAGHPTVRLGYSQVFGTSCRTAWKVALLLRRAGWAGAPHPCENCPAELDWGVLLQAG